MRSPVDVATTSSPSPLRGGSGRGSASLPREVGGGGGGAQRPMSSSDGGRLSQHSRTDLEGVLDVRRLHAQVGDKADAAVAVVEAQEPALAAALHEVGGRH